MLQSLSVCVSVRRWVTSAVCAAGVKGVQGWPTGTSWVSSLLSMSWPPGRESSTAGWAASGSSSSHHYVAEVRGSLHLCILTFEPLNIVYCAYYYKNKVCVFVYSAPQRVCVHHWASRALTSSFLSVRVFSIWAFWSGDTPRHLPTSCMMHRVVMSLSYHCWRTSSTFWTFIKSKVYLFVSRHKNFLFFFHLN